MNEMMKYKSMIMIIRWMNEYMNEMMKYKSMIMIIRWMNE